jgi:hypothetical protein
MHKTTRFELGSLTLSFHGGIGDLNLGLYLPYHLSHAPLLLLLKLFILVTETCLYPSWPQTQILLSLLGL